MAVSQQNSIAYGADQFHRRSGGFGPTAADHGDPLRQTGDRPWQRPITAPCSSSRPARSGKSSAISTITRFWVHGEGFSEIEEGKSGDTIGAVRSVLYRERRIRQRLLAQSDTDRFQTYEFADAPTLPLQDFQATLRVTPVIDGDRAFIEWSAVFDCDPTCRTELSRALTGWFETWLESLRDRMAL
ncbi:SRPBCC family protein [Bradyrhizobium ivorense]|uniref:SRPBCC family protein n=1 Tax=Bradyrhizobium ivorense TaxID=2511166 RepID=UPI001E654C38|nr:SRPBCC family protein [Bradyrhizobium ivorense]